MKINPTTRRTALTTGGEVKTVTITHCAASPIKWGVVLENGGVRPLYRTKNGMTDGKDIERI